MSQDNYIEINIARDFTKSPGARYKSDGKYSGEEFYEDILKPKLSSIWEDPNKKILIDFDGTFGYAYSFISQVFTKVVEDFREKDKIKEKLEFKSDDEPLLINSIRQIMDETKMQ